jgi:hypothetical protein
MIEGEELRIGKKGKKRSSRKGAREMELNLPSNGHFPLGSQVGDDVGVDAGGSGEGLSWSAVHFGGLRIECICRYEVMFDVGKWNRKQRVVLCS